MCTHGSSGLRICFHFVSGWEKSKDKTSTLFNIFINTDISNDIICDNFLWKSKYL